MDLTTLRGELDTIDQELLKLFIRRMDICADIARYKIANNLPVFHPEREDEILTRAAQNAGEEMAPYARQFFQSLMDTSKALQSSLVEANEK